MSGYLQRLYDRAAVPAATRPMALPAGPSSSPVAEADQRLNDPLVAARFGRASAFDAEGEAAEQSLDFFDAPTGDLRSTTPPSILDAPVEASIEAPTEHPGVHRRVPAPTDKETSPFTKTPRPPTPLHARDLRAPTSGTLPLDETADEGETSEPSRAVAPARAPATPTAVERVSSDAARDVHLPPVPPVAKAERPSPRPITVPVRVSSAPARPTREDDVESAPESDASDAAATTERRVGPVDSKAPARKTRLVEPPKPLPPSLTTPFIGPEPSPPALPEPRGGERTPIQSPPPTDRQEPSAPRRPLTANEASVIGPLARRQRTHTLFGLRRR